MVLFRIFRREAAHGFMGYGWGITESVKHYFSLASENKKLSEEIFRLNKELAEWKVMKEGMKLDELSSSYHTIGTASDGFSYMPATVVKNSLNKQHNYLIIGKGSEDGVKPQSGIITSEGVVGIVDAVSRHYSYAISFLNTELSISARIGDDGAAGPMDWDGKMGRCYVKSRSSTNSSPETPYTQAATHPSSRQTSLSALQERPKS